MAAFNQDILSNILPIGDRYPPALTIGLVVFLPFLFLLNTVVPVNDFIALSPHSLTSLNLNQLSLYPLGHLSIFHLLLNLLAIITPLSQYERRNGTVYTGVMLNMLTMATALMYSILGLLFYPNSKVIGISGWVFSFAGFFAYKESLLKPTYQITPTISLPTVFTPVVPLILIAIFIPGSSFWGHAFGLVAGYILAFGYIAKLAPPSKVIEWIEVKADKLINLIPTPFKYYREIDAKHLREHEDYVSIIPSEIVSAASEGEQSTFHGEGRVLGV